MRAWLIFIVFTVVASVYSLADYFSPRIPEHHIFINAQVLTMDNRNSIAEAVALEGNRIIAVGSNQEIIALAESWKSFEQTDLENKTMMPGFIDSHSHFPGSGLSAVLIDLNSPPIGQVESISQALELLRAKAALIPKGEWIIAFGYDDTLLEEKRHFSRADLDQVSTDHPIYVLHTSLHMGVANSKALAHFDITETSTNPLGGEIVREQGSQVPSGLLTETAHHPFAEKALDLSLSQTRVLLRESIESYLSEGVTSAQVGLAQEKLVLPLAVASKIKLIPLRLMLFPDELLGLKILDGKANFRSWESEYFEVGAVKLVADGSIQGYTGYLTEPYTQVKEAYGNDYKGFPIYDQGKLNDLVSRFHGGEMQLAIHGNGDAAIDMILDAFEMAQAQNLQEDPRLILIHAQMARVDQLKRMKSLGVTPSFFSSHVFYWGDRHRKLFIGERAEKISPAKSAENINLRFTHHLDTPVVPMSPLFSAWVAVNRQTRSGKVLGASERISTQQALRGLTIDAAYQVFKDKSLGSIEVGKLADLVVLSENPLSTNKSLKDIQVLKTIIGGSLAYERAE